MPELNEICTEQDEIELLRREQGRVSVFHPQILM